MKKIQLLFFRNYIFIFNLVKCVREDFPLISPKSLVFVTRTDFVYSNLKNSTSDFSKYWLIRNKFGTDWIQSIGPIHDLFW